MLASTGVWRETAGQEYNYLKRQVIWVGLGSLVAAGFALTDYHYIRRLWGPLAVLSTILLICCYLPVLGMEINGETRWIKMPLIGRFQPSELAKLSIMITLGAWFARYQSESKKIVRGFVIPGVLVGIPIMLVLFQTDMGTAASMAGASFLVFFLAGSRVWILGLSVAVGVGVLTVLVKENKNRNDRIDAFYDLEGHKTGIGLQQHRAKIAFANGGITGVGIGNSAEKHASLPEAHTDFIFPILAEELGLVGSLVIVFAFVVLTVFGFGIALASPSHFGKILGAGLTCIIVVPALMNMGVATHLLPVTGLPLPFVSYGGSNLVFTLAMIGILLSIHRHSILHQRDEIPELPSYAYEARI